VVAVAVELDGQVVLGPAAVDVVCAGGAVGHRQRPAHGAHVLEETAFEPAEEDVDVADQHRA
jgi:hypothetical protein